MNRFYDFLSGIPTLAQKMRQMKKGILFITTTILTIFIIESKAQETLDKVSPDGKFKIDISGRDMADCNIEYTMKLINLAQSDTFLLGKTIRHDFPTPNWFWDKDSEYLICENGKTKKIEFWNLSPLKMTNEIDGNVAIIRSYANQFWDCQNEILIYFKTGSYREKIMPGLFSYDVNSRQIKLLHTFDEYFDIVLPTVILNPEERQLKIEDRWVNY